MPDSLLKKKNVSMHINFVFHKLSYLSMNSTWVKGKCPTFPLSSPSHCPFMDILVTLTMSPTWTIAHLNGQLVKNLRIKS
jgi:hypothetical protein